MKIVKFILFFIIIGGIVPSYALPYDNINGSFAKNLSSTQYHKFINETNNFKLLDYTYLDIEEEYSSDEDNHNTLEKKAFIEKNTVVLKLYSTHSLYFISNFKDKSFKILLPSYGNSPPIYITQKVLRI